MRWLLLKDLRILRRSPLLVALLVVYPVVIALLIGLALSRGPGQAEGGVRQPGAAERQHVQARRPGDRRVQVRQRAVRVGRPDRGPQPRGGARQGEIGRGARRPDLPPDIAEKLGTRSAKQPQVEVIYNTEDPVKRPPRRPDRSTRAWPTPTRRSRARLREIAVQDIDLLLDGGEFSLLGRVAGHPGPAQDRGRSSRRRSRTLPPRRAAAARAGAASSASPTSPSANLDLAADVVGTVAQPVKVKRTPLAGKRTPLDAFAVAVAVTVSLMFVTVLLARDARAGARGARFRPAGARAGLAPRAAHGEDRAGRAVRLGGRPGHDVRARHLRRHCDWGRFPLWVVALVCRPRWPSARSGWRSAGWRGRCGRRRCSPSCCRCRSRSWRSSRAARCRAASTT